MYKLLLTGSYTSLYPGLHGDQKENNLSCLRMDGEQNSFRHSSGHRNSHRTSNGLVQLQFLLHSVCFIAFDRCITSILYWRPRPEKVLMQVTQGSSHTFKSFFIVYNKTFVVDPKE